MTVHVATAPLPPNVHALNVPVPLLVKVTLPPGVIAVPGEESVTVTLQVDPWLITTGVAHDTVVVVARGLTTMLVVPLLLL